MLPENVAKYLPFPANKVNASSSEIMQAAENCMASQPCTEERVTVEAQLLDEAIAEQAYCEEEEEEAWLERPYLAFKIAFEEARDHLEQVAQKLKCLRSAYNKEKNLELTANAQGKSDEAYKRFESYREKEFYPAFQRYRDARKDYFSAFITRQMSRVTRFMNEIKKIFERFMIKPIKKRWEKTKSFNKPVYHVPEDYQVLYDGEAVEIKKEKKLHSPLEEMQNGLENKKATQTNAGQMPESEVSANSLSYRHR